MSRNPFFPKTPVCVDLDGTLIYGNSFWKLLRNIPWTPDLLSPLSWPSIKKKVTQRATLGMNVFSYYLPLIHRLKEWKAKGVPIYLVTGAHETIANEIAHHLPFFQEVYASTGTVNLVGKKKASLLKETFRPFGFTYVGDSWKDLPVWQYSRDVLVVKNASLLLRKYLSFWKQSHQRLLVV